VVLTSESVEEILECNRSRHRSDIKEINYFFMLYKMMLTFERVDEILKFDRSNESCGTLLSHGAVHYALQSDSKSVSL